MPDLVTHTYFAEQVLSSLPEEQRRRLTEAIVIYASSGPDVWFFRSFCGGRGKRLTARAGFMHENRTGNFLCALVERAKISEARDALFSYLVGYLCHYALDTSAHPYIEYKTGNYNGTPDTLRYRGNHTRLERAIDDHIIRHRCHTTEARYPLLRRSLPLRRLPKTLSDDLNAVYREVYGWENVWDDLNHTIRDHRLFYRIIHDRLGLMDRLARCIDDGRSPIDLRVMSYHNRTIHHEELDYLNERQAEWRNPSEPSIRSTEGFWELFEVGRVRALELIDITYSYVYLDIGTPSELRAAVGNLSYTTGLDCTRPFEPDRWSYEPLF